LQECHRLLTVLDAIAEELQVEALTVAEEALARDRATPSKRGSQRRR